MFDFPEGIGPVECVNVEHEEVLLMPRWVDAKRVTFKYGLGDEFIGILKTLHQLGPRQDRAAARALGRRPGRWSRRATSSPPACPTRRRSGPRMTGKTCAGLWVTGTGKDGKPREVYLYHVSDNEWTMAEYESQCVVWQTALNPVIALELLATGIWTRHRRARPGGVRRAAVPRPDGAARVADGGYGQAWGLEDRLAD